MCYKINEGLFRSGVGNGDVMFVWMKGVRGNKKKLRSVGGALAVQFILLPFFDIMKSS